MNAKTGNVRRALVNEAGTRIVQEAVFYTVEFFDRDVRRVRKSTHRGLPRQANQRLERIGGPWCHRDVAERGNQPADLQFLPAGNQDVHTVVVEREADGR